MLTQYILTYTPIILSSAALTLSVFTWNRNHKNTLYDACDVGLSELIKISMQYPQYRSEELCLKVLKSDDDIERLRYDGYCTLVWNYLETLYDKHGSNITKSPFYGSLQSLGQRHRHWLFSDDNYHYYPVELLAFLKIERP